MSIYFDVTRERIKRIEYRALRNLAIRELKNDAPRWRGITEEEIEAKIAELIALFAKFHVNNRIETFLSTVW